MRHIHIVRISLRLGVALLFSLLVACSSNPPKDGPPKHTVDVSQIANAVPRNEPKSRYGNPKSYVVADKRYYVLPTATGYDKRGIASWYGTKFHGRLTSSREPYDMMAMTAASPELPIPCYVQVTNLENSKQIIVRVNDRGPFAPNRIIDLSYAAATKLGFSNKGTALVEVIALTDTPGPIFASASTAPVSGTSTTKPQLFLQIGAFHYEHNADQLQQRVQQLTQKTVRIKVSHAHADALYLVQIGPLVGVGESDTLLAQLHQAGFNQAITVIS